MKTEKTVAVVTGGSGGIGEAVCLRLANDGFAVAVCCNSSAEKAEKTAEKINSSGGCAKVFQFDISNSTAVKNAVEEIERDFGEIGVLVNNAGIAQQALFTDITDEMWQKMLAVNLDGAFYCSRSVLPFMIHRKKGKIINISSIWGETGGSCEVHYSAAKAGLLGLTKALAKEAGLSGITVNSVSPGVILTPMTAIFSEETLNELKAEGALNRLGTPEDVAAAVSFLASDGADFITGQDLAVNGGMYI